MTCWTYTDLKDLPSKRSELYEEGLNLLLSKWDETRGINRDSGNEIYRELSEIKRVELLSYLAAEKFRQEQPILFQQNEIKKYIVQYLNISDDQSEGVLNAIESQHGILIKRAQKIWSFSHLTFHEYLAAKWFIEHSKQQKELINQQKELINLFISNEWKEVLFSYIEMLPQANDFLPQINWENIKQAYRDSLPPDAELWDLQSVEPDSIVEILKIIDEFRRLVCFFKRIQSLEEFG